MKRYKADESFVRTKMVEDPQGEWVKFEDVKAELDEWQQKQLDLTVNFYEKILNLE